MSLLAGESIDRVKEKLPSLSDGAFAENIISRGMDYTALQIVDQLQQCTMSISDMIKTF